jgi:hypothetical protein
MTCFIAVSRAYYELPELTDFFRVLIVTQHLPFWLKTGGDFRKRHNAGRNLKLVIKSKASSCQGKWVPISSYIFS